MTLDLHTLTADVCKLLGGKNESQSEHAMTRFAILDGAVTLVMRKGYGATANKVTIHAYIAAEDALEYHQRTKFESITVTGTRPAEAVAKEITRRLLDGVEIKIAEALARVNAHNATKSAVKERAAKWAQDFPGLSITVNDDGMSARLYFNKGGKYLNGDMQRDGSISIQRLSLDGEASATQLLGLIAGEAK
jgi:hypothetical protein